MELYEHNLYFLPVSYTQSIMSASYRGVELQRQEERETTKEMQLFPIQCLKMI
jgi:hypothetical protein